MDQPLCIAVPAFDGVLAPVGMKDAVRPNRCQVIFYDRKALYAAAANWPTPRFSDVDIEAVCVIMPYVRTVFIMFRKTIETVRWS